MQYPLISEYVDAIRSAEDNFDKLCNLRPVLDSNDNPIMSSGNFAVVFKMKDVNTGKLYAVKCFTKEQEGREEAYRQIADELEFVQSTYLAKVKYCDKELFVDTNSSNDNEFPVLLMDWVGGVTLDKYIRQHIHDKYLLEMLAYNFSRLAMWLLPQPFAHGDLKPDNILVHDDGSLTLVDYDGMYVPAMQEQKSRELGSPDFRHPLRTEDDFNEHIDDFPAISILLSLRLIASDTSFLDQYGAADRLLFSESDYRDLSACSLLKFVFPSQNAEINTLVSLFVIACTHRTLTNVSFHLLAIAKPNKLEIIEVEELSKEVTDDDLASAVVDEFGAQYSKDGKRLLAGVDIVEYKIKEGTKIICNGAFLLCSSLQQVTIPTSVTSIGDFAFSNCESLRQITIPSNVINIGEGAFACCESLRQVLISTGVMSIGDSAFIYCNSLQQITIPTTINRIIGNPFIGCHCKILNRSPYFIVKDDVLYNENMSVLISYLGSQTVFIIPEKSYCIGDFAFWCCSSLKQLTIPASINKIGKNPFVGCHCKVLNQSPYFNIKDDTLYNADMSVLIACWGNQTIFEIPHSVTAIESMAFWGCDSLLQITISDSVKCIGDHAFVACRLLRQIKIPQSVTSIGDFVLDSSYSVEQISIPKGCRTKFEQMLPDYKDKLVEVDNL